MKKFLIGTIVGLIVGGTIVFAWNPGEGNTQLFKLVRNGKIEEGRTITVLENDGKSYIDADFLKDINSFKMDTKDKTIQIENNSLDVNEVIGLSYVKEHLQQGITIEQVKKFFGDKYVEYDSENPNSIMWRMDFEGKKGYVYDPAAIGKAQSEVDVAGLKSGDMKAQIGIEYVDHKVKRFVAHFHDNGKIKEYRMFADGTVRESFL